MGELTEHELRAFAGSNASYYVRQWQRAEPGFNVAAFLFAGLWLPYRKMYPGAALLYAVSWLSVAFEPLAPFEKGVSSCGGSAFGLIVAIVTGICGNRWYLERARRIVAEERAQGLPDDEYFVKLARRGGTSILAALAFPTLFLVGTGLVAFLAEVLTERHFERGYDLIQRDDFDGAVAAFTDGLRDDPNDADALVNRGYAYGMLGRHDDAIRDYTAALRLRPGDAFARTQRARHYLSRGLARHKAGDVTGAVSDYDLSLGDAPSDPYAVGNRGLARLHLNDYAAALADFDRAVALAPADAAWRAYRAATHLALGHDAAATEDCDAALKLSPDHAFANCLHGDILLRRKDWPAALAALDRAARAGDDSADLHADRGNALLHLDRYAEAVSALEAALRQKAEHRSATYTLAWLLASCPDAAHRDGARAAEMARRLCELSKWQVPQALSVLAAAEAECGQFDEAVRHQEDALGKALTGDKEFHERALALYKSGRPYRIGDDD